MGERGKFPKKYHKIVCLYYSYGNAYQSTAQISSNSSQKGKDKKYGCHLDKTGSHWWGIRSYCHELLYIV